MRKLLIVLLAGSVILSGCAEGLGSEEVGDDELVGPRSLAETPIPEPGTELVTETIAGGVGAEQVVGAGGSVLIDSPDQWEEFWSQARPRETNRPDPDFANDKVIVVARAVPTGGYRLEATEMTTAERSVVVKVNVVTPGPECMTTQAISYPWVAVRVPYYVTGVEVQDTVITDTVC